VAEERDKALAEVDARKSILDREIAAMHKHKEAQEGRVELNIGRYRFETSVQTLRRVPHTFFDAYFSGRYAQDVCADGSIFVHRDGEHFGHVLEYMRDGHVSVAEAGACPSVSLLRALKREFGFYCIELSAELPLVPEQPETAYLMGGHVTGGRILSSMEQYDAISNEWIAAAAMGTARDSFGTCSIAGELYVAGGFSGGQRVASVEKYVPSSDTWSTVAPMPAARADHAAVAVGSSMYILGGILDHSATSTVLRFDTSQGTWSEVAPLPSSRYDRTACALGSDIYVFGGTGINEEAHNYVFKYDTVANAWSNVAPMPFNGRALSVSVIDEMIYVVGSGRRNVRSFEPASGAWKVLAPTRPFSTSFVLNEKLYVAGGAGSRGSVERYDVATDTWTVVADMLEGRAFSGAAKPRSRICSTCLSPRPPDNLQSSSFSVV
jgi:hypothetical protein